MAEVKAVCVRYILLLVLISLASFSKSCKLRQVETSKPSAVVESNTFFSTYASSNPFVTFSRAQPFSPKLSDLVQVDWSIESLKRNALNKAADDISPSIKWEFGNCYVRNFFSGSFKNGKYLLRKRNSYMLDKIHSLVQDKKSNELKIFFVGGRHAMDFYLKIPKTLATYVSPHFNKNTLVFGSKYKELIKAVGLNINIKESLLFDNDELIFNTIFSVIAEHRLLGSIPNTTSNLSGKKIEKVLSGQQPLKDSHLNLLFFMDFHGANSLGPAYDFPPSSFWKKKGINKIKVYLEGVKSRDKPYSFREALFLSPSYRLTPEINETLITLDHLVRKSKEGDMDSKELLQSFIDEEDTPLKKAIPYLGNDQAYYFPMSQVLVREIAQMREKMVIEFYGLEKS